jgi:manganese transport protein
LPVDGLMGRRSLSERTAAAGVAALEGRRRGLAAWLPFVGPALIASIAYMDPGNFATNIQAGARYGYSLLWVVVLANLVAMLFQALSARLGIVTGRSLAAMCRARFPRPVRLSMWVASEVAAMATDLAEFLGGAIGLSLLLHIPLMAGLVLTGIATYAILLLGQRGFRPLEIVVAVFVGVISLSYAAELVIAPPNWAGVVAGIAIPRLADGGAVALSVAIIGATVMPHAIYLHSALMHSRVPTRSDADRRRVLRYSNWEVLVALGLAGVVNMAMVAMAAATFHPANPDVADIETAYWTLTPLLGAAAGVVFLASLLASGLSSSVVATMAGQSIMQDFLHLRTPLWLRRAVTMAPAFVVVGLGANATDSLVYSQVVLSLTLPVPMIALMLLANDRDVMGEFASGWALRWAGWLATVVVLVLNALLLLGVAGIGPASG